MIFAAFGTAGPFPRLLTRLDELAQESGMEIVVQTGTTPRTARFCKMFDYAPSLTEYVLSSSLVISHAGLGLPMELLNAGKPFVVVPRLAKYGEHANDHQLEIAEMLHRKYGVLSFPDTHDLTVELLKNPPAPYPFSDAPLRAFRENIRSVLFGTEEKK